MDHDVHVEWNFINFSRMVVKEIQSKLAACTMDLAVSAFYRCLRNLSQYACW